MKKRNRRLGDLFSSFLKLEKEVYPLFTNGGMRKVRRGYFSCIDHPEAYYLLTYTQAKRYCGMLCPCLYRAGKYYSGYITRRDKKDMQDYSYMTDMNAHRKVLDSQHPSWFEVDKDRILVDGEIFYEFEGKSDYRVAKGIEDTIWNSKHFVSKEFYLARFSHRLDEMHRDGELLFESMLWNRGAGVEFFREYLNAVN